MDWSKIFEIRWEWPLSVDGKIDDDIESRIMKQSSETSHVLLASSERVSEI